MQLRKQPGFSIAFSPVLAIHGNSVEIVAQVWDVAAGSYVYDVEITLADGRVKTWMGGTVTIETDVTE